MSPVNELGNTGPTSRAPSPEGQSTHLNKSCPTGSSSALPGLEAAHQTNGVSCVDATRVLELGREVDDNDPKDKLLDYCEIGPGGLVARIDHDKHGLGDDDAWFAKLLCGSIIQAQPGLKENTLMTEDVLFLKAMNIIRDVKALNLPHADQPKEVIYRLKEPMIQAINEAHVRGLEHADYESMTPNDNRNISDETSQQETLSEQTDSSEETTAGFIIDIWWSALREANKNAVKVVAPKVSSSVQKHREAMSDLMSSSTIPTAAETHHQSTDEATGNAPAGGPASSNSTTMPASDWANLPNVWRDTTNDPEASGANLHEPFTPIGYDSNDFPMLLPIQNFTDVQVQAIKAATAEAKQEEGSETEKG